MTMSLLNAGLAGLLIAAAWDDWRRRRISNKLIIAGLVAFAINAAWLAVCRQGGQVAGSLLAGGLAFLIHLLPYCFGHMGAGDVKLALVIGLLLGWQVWQRYLGAYCAVLVVCAVLLLLLGQRRPKSLPLAPLMAAAFFLTIW
jgi:leader peptidase (prepilin peptidase)/N-methyltransferase